MILVDPFFGSLAKHRTKIRPTVRMQNPLRIATRNSLSVSSQNS